MKRDKSKRAFFFGSTHVNKKGNSVYGDSRIADRKVDPVYFELITWRRKGRQGNRCGTLKVAKMDDDKPRKASSKRIHWPIDSGAAALIVSQEFEKLIAENPGLAVILSEVMDKIINRLMSI